MKIPSADCKKSALCAALLGVLTATGCLTAGLMARPLDFRGADNRTVFRFERDGDSVLARDAAGRTLCEVRLDSAGVSVLGPDGVELGSVGPLAKRSGLRVRDADGQEMFELRVDEDGDFELLDRASTVVNVGKDRSYGMKVVNGADEIESRVRNRPPRISIRDRDGNRYLRAKGDLPSIAVAALTLESVPFPFAVGLAVALTRGDHEAPREVQPR